MGIKAVVAGFYGEGDPFSQMKKNPFETRGAFGAHSLKPN